MNRHFTIHFLIFFLCSLIYATGESDSDLSAIYPVKDKKSCAFPFEYKSKIYHDCTNDGDNGDIPWCSLTKKYKGVIKLCYDFRKTTVKCLDNYTMPNNKVYSGCAILSPTSPYPQCKTNHPVIKYAYCINVTDAQMNQPLIHTNSCDPSYANLTSDHTMW